MPKEQKPMRIPAEDMRKLQRRVNREERLRNGNFIRGGPHKTSKLDIEDELSNTVSEFELQDIIEEEKKSVEDYEQF
jgi:hypothetical protein